MRWLIPFFFFSSLFRELTICLFVLFCKLHSVGFLLLVACFNNVAFWFLVFFFSSLVFFLFLFSDFVFIMVATRIPFVCKALAFRYLFKAHLLFELFLHLV